MQQGDNFGWSVSLDRDTALIGAPFNDDNGQDSGSAYVFTKGSENQPPNANFTFTPENPTTIDTIQFTDISIDADGTIVSWSWDFGDGIGTSNEQNPTYQYLNPGTYSLILTVTDDNLATDTITKEINITPPIHKPVHNLNSGEDFYTIQSAIDDPDTVEGHTIFVESGIYNENVNIWKSITLFGEDRDNTIIDGGGRGNVVNITANRVNISGFTVRNENLVYGWSGIFLDYVSLCRIEDNTVQDNTNNGKGINLKCSNNNNIIANNISNNQIGIIVESCSNNIISCNNVLYNIDYGIDLGFGDTCNNIVTGNTVFNNAYTGIFLAGSDNNIIGNTISKNRFGICVSGGFNTVRGNTIFSNIVIGIFNMGGYNTIIDNVLSNNTCGIQIEYSLTNNHILANNISNSQYGIYLEFSTSNNDITGNTISKNNIGIVLSENSHANTINNNIFNNTNNAYDYGNNIWNISKISGANIIGGQYLGGNYWSDYTGEDLDSDGLGDTNVPYGPGDYLPLVSPIQNQPPYTPSNPSPTNGATEVNINSHLSWIGGDPNQDDTDTYDVFFGTSNPPPKSVSNQTGTTYDPGTMQNVTIYYWRIVSWDNHGASTSGPVWNFTTQRPGYIKAWGDNGSGQCDVPEPNTDFIAIAAGNDHSLGLKANGSIIAWGENSYGQCNAPNPNTDFISVAAGVCYSLGLKADGSIIAWGWNNSGQCNVPEPNTDFIAIAAKGHHSLGLKTDGSIVAWGYNGSGQCDVPEPNTDFIAIAAGYLHSLGLKANGSIVAWGDNYWGQSNLPEPNTDFIAIAAGIYHNLGLKTDSSIVAWGNNLAGACNVPEPNTNFIAVAAGIYHSLGLKANGSIVAWGTNNGGQCNVPEPNTDFIAIAAGWSHSLGIKVNSPPYTPSNPNPSDTAIHVPLNTPLGWNGGDPDQGDTVTYDVYFGTTNPPPLQIQNQTETTFNPGTLNYSSMYYWQIVVWDNHGTSTPGPTWSFTTELQPGFFMNLNNFPMYPAIATPGYHEMCGPAVAQMTLNYLWWNSSNDSTPPMTFDNQTWLYQRGKENNTNTTLPYLDTQGIWNIIQYNEPMPYATYGYNFAPDASTDQSYMLKEICTWINYTIGTYGGHKPGHPTNVPAIVPAYGDYSNWMTIRGFHSDQPAYPPQSNLTIYGFWVNDPYPSSLGGMGENSYKTVGDWLGTYYKPLQTDDQYNGKYVAICEPPITKDNTKVTLGSSPARFTKDQLSLINDVKTRFITNKPIEESIQKQVNQWVIDAATQGLTEQLLPYDNEFASAFVKTTPGQPLLVQNLNNGDDYYLVPFNIPLKKQIIEPVSMPVDLRHEVIEEPIDVPLTVDEIDNAKPIDDAKPVATPLPIDDTQNVEPILKTGTTVVVIIDANDGSFKEASWTKKPVTYLPISQDNARQLVIKYCKEKGIDLKDPTTMTIDLVYRHSSPYYPEWRITIEEPKLEFYISQDGNYTL